jgi:hypothetical protein
VFTTATARTDFDSRPRAHPAATVSPSGGGTSLSRFRMIKDAIANSPNRLRVKLSSGLTCDGDPESIIHCIVKFLFAPYVTLSCLDRSVAKQKLNLFQFAS